MASGNKNAHRKLFIKGLGSWTGEQVIKEFFSQFGEVEEVILVKHRDEPGNPRGRAFVVFRSAEAVRNTLAAKDLFIDGRKVKAERPRDFRFAKLFVGGIPSHVTEGEIRAHFEAFGEIEDIEFPFDKVRNMRRDFCFIFFAHHGTVINLLDPHMRTLQKHVLGGVEVRIAKARVPDNEYHGDYFTEGARRLRRYCKEETIYSNGEPRRLIDAMKTRLWN